MKDTFSKSEKQAKLKNNSSFEGVSTLKLKKNSKKLEIWGVTKTHKKLKPTHLAAAMLQVGLKLNSFGGCYVSGRAETQLANTLVHLPGQATWLGGWLGGWLLGVAGWLGQLAAAWPGQLAC